MYLRLVVYKSSTLHIVPASRINTFLGERPLSLPFAIRCGIKAGNFVSTSSIVNLISFTSFNIVFTSFASSVSLGLGVVPVLLSFGLSGSVGFGFGFLGSAL